jgi:hypothetical protein
MVRLTHGKPNDIIHSHDLNFWLAQYNRNHANLADDCEEACKTLGVDWAALFIFLVSRSKWCSEIPVDVFKTGCTEPGFPEQLKQAATVWNSVTDMAELKYTPEELDKFDKINRLWKLRESFLIERRTGTAPEVPPMTEMPKPKPEPVSPPKPSAPSKSWKEGLPKLPGILKPIISFALGFLVGFLDKILDKFLGPNDYDKWIRPILDWVLSIFTN